MTDAPPHVYRRIAEDVARRVPHSPVEITPELVEMFLTADIKTDHEARKAIIALPFGVPAMITREAKTYGLEPAGRDDL